jgi:hypothetical protein
VCTACSAGKYLTKNDGATEADSCTSVSTVDLVFSYRKVADDHSLMIRLHACSVVVGPSQQVARLRALPVVLASTLQRLMGAQRQARAQT